MNKTSLTVINLRLLLIGAIVAVASIVRAADVLEEVVEQDYPIDPGAKFTLQNDDGSVLIYGADIAQMKLQARKRAYSKERLSRISVDVAVRPGEVDVRTGYPPKPKWGLFDRSGTVDYVIILPWHCDVKQAELGNGEVLIDGMRGNEVCAQLGSGRLSAHNCFSETTKLSLRSGGFDLVYDWWEKHHMTLEATIAAGNTRVLIPGEAQLRLHTETEHGHIFSDFNNRENLTRRGQAKADLLVGDVPNAEMQIRAFDGSIHVKENNP